MSSKSQHRVIKGQQQQPLAKNEFLYQKVKKEASSGQQIVYGL